MQLRLQKLRLPSHLQQVTHPSTCKWNTVIHQFFENTSSVHRWSGEVRHLLLLLQEDVEVGCITEGLQLMVMFDASLQCLQPAMATTACPPGCARILDSRSSSMLYR